jgi:hypothetical protein
LLCPLAGNWAHSPTNGGGMTKQTEKSPTTNNGQEIAYGYWPFFRAWLLTFAIMIPIILILKYYFKLI